MVRAGDTIANPVTGERLVFELTSNDMKGEYTLFDTFVEPRATVAAAHVHPCQTEIFTVIEGRLAVKRGRETARARPARGGADRSRAGARVWNAGEETLRFRAEVRPAL